MDQDVYKLFAESLRYHGTGDLDTGFHVIEDLLGNWSEICERLAEEVDTDRENFWHREKQTWDLLRLVQNVDRGRLLERESSIGDATYATPAGLVAEGMKESAERTRLLAVMSWLEMNPSTVAMCERRPEYLGHTRTVLNRRGKGIGAPDPADAAVVSQLDPDVDIREAPKRLDDGDRAHEAAFVRALFWLVRAGHLDRAIDWCRESNAAWRAASLAGGRLWEQERSDGDTKPGFAGKPYAVGNIKRELWKKACFALSRDDSVSEFERALYGALCGNVAAVEPVCEDWTDYVWASVVGIIEQCTSETLSKNASRNFWVAMDESLYSDVPTSPGPVLEQLTATFATLRRSEHIHIAKEAHDPYRTAQASIIVDGIDAFLSEYKGLLDSGRLARSASDLAHILRFLVHLLLAYRLVGIRVDYAVSNGLIQAYVKVLEAHAESSDTIAFYTSLLERDDATSAFAAHLATLPAHAPRDARASALLASHSHGLDIYRVATATVDLTTQLWVPSASLLLSTDVLLAKKVSDILGPVHPIDAAPPILHDPFAPLTDMDTGLIRTLDWLLADESTYPAALERVNLLTRAFLCTGNLAAASALRRSLPRAFIASIRSDTSLDDSTYAPHAEYADMAAFFAAVDAYSSLVQVLPVLKRDQAALVQLTDNLHALTRNVLTSAWLQYTEPSPILDRIRAIYIPELVFRLAYVLVHAAPLNPELSKSLFALAGLIADPKNGLSPEFLALREHTDVNYLAIFLTMVRQASVVHVDAYGSFV